MLHTHSRNLNYHPHIHVVVPGGGVDRGRRQWKTRKAKYLFNQKALSKVFRGRFLSAISISELSMPKKIPGKWIVNCSYAGKGVSALKYLSRYLYRGIMYNK
ncbi:MAG: hypothetical protein GY760_12710 [Deltaproteobacteria bacterium]|nr:hypothetical protein [Deltaproteobacteria bacterium]